jgi:hypothetical protein
VAVLFVLIGVLFGVAWHGLGIIIGAVVGVALGLFIDR